jgi:hypothetical protein
METFETDNVQMDLKTTRIILFSFSIEIALHFLSVSNFYFSFILPFLHLFTCVYIVPPPRALLLIVF